MNRIKQLNSLTAFRFIAAFMVFAYHWGILEKYQLGKIGVSFFFVLSGFILAYNYHLKFKNLSKEKIKKFYLARFAKIYPVHVLTFLISFPLFLVLFHPHGSYLIKLTIISGINLLLVQSYIPNQDINFGFNGVSWSISDEFFFYFLFPFILRMFIKFNLNKKIKKNISVAIFVWIVLLSISVLRSFGSVGNNDFITYIFPPIRIFDFIIGVLLGLTFVENEKNNSIGTALFTFLESFTLVFLITSIILSPYIGDAFTNSSYYLPFLSTLIYVFAFQRGYISKSLSNKLLIFLGEVSFSFYMIHELTIPYIIQYLHIDKFNQILISFMISVIISSLVYKFYEEPLRKKIRNTNLNRNNKFNDSNEFIA